MTTREDPLAPSKALGPLSVPPPPRVRRIVDHSFFQLFQVSAALASDDGADHTRVKQEKFMAC